MRASGILMHISSLPSAYGIGTLGAAAYEFADFLEEAGQQLWQILPVTPTSYGDSPYQSFSTFAGNPYFIDLDLLAKDGLLEPAEYAELDWGDDPARADYALLYQNRFPVLRKAYARFTARPPAAFAAFCEEQQAWLNDFALFMALKEAHQGRSWIDWEDPLRLREGRALARARKLHKNEMDFWRFLQFEFRLQWEKLKTYVNAKGIRIIGDIPIYVALDSADVWANPALFMLDENRRPLEVAGCPPDYFARTGQLWGNPIYNWDACKRTGYRWWVQRIAAAVSLYDTVRIDHFRGFERFWAIPAADKTAENGVWRVGPGMDLFRAVRKALGDDAPIIAEDLGTITEEVRALLRESGYPGMKVLQFAFPVGQESDYLPHNYEKNCICYTGTHDNDTLSGWLDSISEAELDYASRYTRSSGAEDLAEGIIAAAWASPADTAITTMQDLLGLGTEARMNLPSTPSGNWQWRLLPGALTPELSEWLRELTRLYWRR